MPEIGRIGSSSAYNLTNLRSLSKSKEAANANTSTGIEGMGKDKSNSLQEDQNTLVKNGNKAEKSKKNLETSDSKTEKTEKTGKNEKSEKSTQEVSDEDKSAISRLKMVENEVIAHEQAHKSAGGSIAGAASYSYSIGPDGKRYITGGEVSLRTPATDDKEQKVNLLNRVKQAALAPAQPSSQDIRVAAGASAEQVSLNAAIQKEKALQAYDKTQKTQGPEKDAKKEKDTNPLEGIGISQKGQDTKEPQKENVKYAPPGKYFDKVG